jgi:hypothetical protein
MITPAQVEKRLFELSKEMDDAHEALVRAENKYADLKSTYEIAMAKSRMRNSHPDMKMTVVMRDDQALIDNEVHHEQLIITEAIVKANRANVARIRTQVDIARSISSSIKATLEL